MQQNWKGFYSYGTVGLELAVSFLLGLFGGRWLDTKLSTSPWFTLGFTGLGLAAGFRAVYRAGVRANKEAEIEDEKERARRSNYYDDD